MIHIGQERALQAVATGDFDIVILDEYNMALFFGLIEEEEGRELLAARNPNVEVVFTGRGAPQWLLDEADLVTVMESYRHYYDQGVEARLGIEH